MLRRLKTLKKQEEDARLRGVSNAGVGSMTADSQEFKQGCSEEEEGCPEEEEEGCPEEEEEGCSEEEEERLLEEDGSSEGARVPHKPKPRTYLRGN